MKYFTDEWVEWTNESLEKAKKFAEGIDLPEDISNEARYAYAYGYLMKAVESLLEHEVVAQDRKAKGEIL